MHELAVTQRIVEIAEQHARGAKVERIEIEIGKLSCASPEAIRFCFDMVAEGTVAEGAELVITQPEGRARCRQCGAEFALDQPVGLCACGSSDLEWVQGEELNVLRLQVQDGAVA